MKYSDLSYDEFLNISNRDRLRDECKAYMLKNALSLREMAIRTGINHQSFCSFIDGSHRTRIKALKKAALFLDKQREGDEV